ncbi:hypothetical protein C488_15692 [Natrinema pellirubrum DSM 15624]|uniref:Cell surface glycoprotein n=1 Tax=Natrinema pellirubrum (strain DSM 15624 / CIP 106293 / JCM 10476 / NCIMB 786 / 157) TaxID=797303 RepID=L0JSY9_NATP1|nr:hypothetical protein [Natrinema pellirubrum]AGB33762.1 hypothetical protein Natpe_4035 [Natrinema pellirubrum DSM 15624]ELY71979.1 hypothetical protein C488_15692 [Natrinema pellirubrum DSM 15624]
MRTGSLSVAVGLLLAATVLLAVPVASQSGYDIEVVNAVSTPEETIELAGTEYSVDGVGIIEPGEPIEMKVTSSDQYRVYLYNTDEKSEYDNVWSADETRVAMGTENDALNTSALEPGTYMLSLEPRGEGRQAVYPVVVQEFELSVEVPETVSTEEEAEFTASVEPAGAASDVDTVDVAIWDEENKDVTEIELEADGEGEFSTAVDPAELGEGEYNVYGGVLSEEEVEGYPTAVAVDSGSMFTVTSDSEGEDGTSGGNTGSGGTGGGSPSSGTENGSDSSSEKDSSPENKAGNETDSSDETDSASGGEAGSAPSESIGGDNETESDTDQDQRIEPTNESDTSDGSAETDGESLGSPGPGPVITLLVLLVVGVRVSH